MSGPPRFEWVADALIFMLNAVTDIPWGDGEAPGGNATAVPPYGVVFPIAGLPSTGDAAAPASETTPVYQLRGVGANRWQAEWIASAARRAVLDRVEGTGAFLNPIDTYLENGVHRHLTTDQGIRVRLREHESVLGHDPDGPFHSYDDRFSLLLEPL